MEYEISPLIVNIIKFINITTVILAMFGIVNIIVELKKKRYKFSIALILAFFNYILTEGYNEDIELYKKLLDGSSKKMLGQRLECTELLILVALTISILWIVIKIIIFLENTRSIRELKKLRDEELKEMKIDK